MTTETLIPLAAEGGGVDATIERFFGPVADGFAAIIFYTVPILGVDVPLIVTWLVIAGLFFTFWLKFLNVRGMRHALDLVRGRYTRPNAVGEVTHFQALATAVSGTVGLGNIAGVAIAITLGGPGAALWMVLAGFLGMSTKMAECMVGVKYRKVHADGTVSGGPMWYLSRGLAEIGRPRLGKVLAASWAFCILFAAVGTTTFQANQATQQLVGVAGDGGFGTALAENRWAIGLGMALLTGAVIFGGIKSIARATSILVPFMAITYVLGCLTVIVVNIENLPSAFGQIVTGAFSPEGVTGGVIGSLIVGFQRATFSNAAGLGDAAVAHSAVRTDRPPTEGFVASLEPFIDTIIICSMTAITIVVTGVWQRPDAEDVGGVTLTSDAFATVLPWFPYVLALAVFLFAYSTILAYAYYGSKGSGYLFGDSQTAENVFKAVVLIFTVIGAAAALGPVVLFADSIFFLLSISNVLGLYFLARIIKRDFTEYWTKLHAGEFERTDRPAAPRRKA